MPKYVEVVPSTPEETLNIATAECEEEVYSGQTDNPAPMGSACHTP